MYHLLVYSTSLQWIIAQAKLRRDLGNLLYLLLAVLVSILVNRIHALSGHLKVWHVDLSTPCSNCSMIETLRFGYYTSIHLANKLTYYCKVNQWQSNMQRNVCRAAAVKVQHAAGPFFARPIHGLRSLPQGTTPKLLYKSLASDRS